VYTTGEVARICHVAPRTVSKWVDTGQLRGYRIPGSRDRRIPVEHLQAFMRAYGIPQDDLESGPCRVLIVEPGVSLDLVEGLVAGDRFEVRTAENEFEAGVAAEQFRPHVIVLGLGPRIEDAIATCANIKQNPALSATRVVAAGYGLGDEQREHLRRMGFDQCLAKPYSAQQLAEAIGE
jgi:excisionase family DNA binding protein